MEDKIVIRETDGMGIGGLAGGVGGLIVGGLAGYALSRWNNNGCGCNNNWNCGCQGAARVFTQGDVDNLLATKNTEYALGTQISDAKYQNALLAEQAATAQAAALCSTTYELANQIGQVREQGMKQTFELSKQMSDCCCSLKQEIAGVVSAFQAEKISALRDEILYLKLKPASTTTAA